MILAAAPRSRRDRRQGRQGRQVRRRSRGRIPILSSHSHHPPRDPSSLRGLSGHYRCPPLPPTGMNLVPVTGGRANTRPRGKVHDALARTSRVRPPTRGSDTSGHRTADSARLTRRRQCPRRGRESRRTTRSRPATRSLCRGARHVTEGDRRTARTTAPLFSRSHFLRRPVPGRCRASAPSRTWPGPAQ